MVEFKRFCDLATLLKAGEITDLIVQEVYPIVINGVKVCKYIADFVYKEKGQLVVEDVKGHEKAISDVFKLKKKLMAACHGLEVKTYIFNQKEIKSWVKQ